MSASPTFAGLPAGAPASLPRQMGRRVSNAAHEMLRQDWDWRGSPKVCLHARMQTCAHVCTFVRCAEGWGADAEGMLRVWHARSFAFRCPAVRRRRPCCGSGSPPLRAATRCTQGPPPTPPHPMMGLVPPQTPPSTPPPHPHCLQAGSGRGWAARTAELEQGVRIYLVSAHNSLALIAEVAAELLSKVRSGVPQLSHAVLFTCKPCVLLCLLLSHSKTLPHHAALTTARAPWDGSPTATAHVCTGDMHGANSDPREDLPP